MKTMEEAVRAAARAEEDTGAFAGDVPVLSDAERERIAHRILFARAGAARPARARRPALVAATAFLAAAAALVLWMRPATEDMTLPGYTIAAQGGAKSVRGGEGPGAQDSTSVSPQRIGRGATLIVSLRPDEAVSGDVAARAFLVRGSELAEARPTEMLVVPGGAVRLLFRGAEIAGGTGPASLRVVVGRPSAVAGVAPAAIRAAESGAGWRAFTVPLVLDSGAD